LIGKHKTDTQLPRNPNGNGHRPYHR
jgi:hypothetical protein